ncbi:EboA domain-containing protein [Myceligenerans pegani]|uniref:EboA domain-containing protein n=1 Tax=Myceligenerans pegani TaxID=2776917 RepID=A0ABR9MWB3_9MICO|nr:EboA domain-containing protein [Myceligenerans sp. TRM 65318]MBE1875286.1 EboA domain-containing protein [Myceligenerans sp. TRM 65318]MBE3017557.1 EboA domain-containing protein [Myceligenerans sp. TRM 65318]
MTGVPRSAGDLALDPAALRPLLRNPGWFDTARAAVAADPSALPRAFALAGRRAGRGPLHPATDPAGVVHGTVDDAARAALVVALATVDTRTPHHDVPRPGTHSPEIAATELATRLTTLYHQGDTAERRGVLRALDALVVRGSAPTALTGHAVPRERTAPSRSPRTPLEPDVPGTSATPASSLPEPLATAGIPLAEDALRANDTSLVAAAVGPFGARHLDAHTWRHAVLKLVFLGVPLDAVAHLDERADAELARMARDLAAERRAAGRDIPPDLTRLLRITKE